MLLCGCGTLPPRDDGELPRDDAAALASALATDRTERVLHRFEAQAREPNASPAVFIALATLYEHAGDVPAAREALDRAGTTSQRAPAALGVRGALALRAGDAAGAVALFDAALAALPPSSPQAPSLQLDRAWALLWAKGPQAAREALRDAGGGKTVRMRAHLLAWTLDFIEGRSDTAIAEMRERANTAPTPLGPTLLLAAALADTDASEAAWQVLEALRRQGPAPIALDYARAGLLAAGFRPSVPATVGAALQIRGVGPAGTQTLLRTLHPPRGTSPSTPLTPGADPARAAAPESATTASPSDAR